MLHELLEDAEILAAPWEITIEQEIAPRAPLHGDPNFLRQLLLNLLDNAIKYNERNGVVRVQLRRSGESWLVRVGNTGPGIPASHDVARLRPLLPRRQSAQSRPRRPRPRPEHLPRNRPRPRRRRPPRQLPPRLDGIPSPAPRRPPRLTSAPEEPPLQRPSAPPRVRAASSVRSWPPSPPCPALSMSALSPFALAPAFALRAPSRKTPRPSRSARSASAVATPTTAPPRTTPAGFPRWPPSASTSYRTCHTDWGALEPEPGQWTWDDPRQADEVSEEPAFRLRRHPRRHPEVEQARPPRHPAGQQPARLVQLCHGARRRISRAR